MSQKPNILYEDKLITITDFCIVINKYYFPLATSKTILFSEMSKISIEDGRKVNHRWGPSPKFLNNWFHLDIDRKMKDRFLSIEIKGSNVRPALTPESIDRAFDVLRKHFGEMDRKSVMFQSNRDQQTQIDQKEADEMMKMELDTKKESSET